MLWTGETEADATWKKVVDLWQFEKEIVVYWSSKEKGSAPATTRVSSSSGGGGLL